MAVAKALILTAGLLLLAVPAFAQSVGNVGAVNQSARGTPPGGSTRTLSVGMGVSRKERIKTDAKGNAQIVFRDKSTMTVGRNSSVTIDKFVYSGDTKKASQGVNLAKGVLRFVGGEVSHTRGSQVKTPTASIGIRGGTALIQVGGSCGTLVVLQYGVAKVSNAQDSVLLTQPGYAVCVPLNGPISQPFQLTAAELATLLESLTSAPGQTGGVANPPTNTGASNQLSDTRSPDQTNVLDFIGTIWFGNTLVQSGANAVNQPPPPKTMPPSSSDPPPQNGGNSNGGHSNGGHSNGGNSNGVSNRE